MPFYHFGFKQIGEIRKALGFRTIFNRIGHLVNPARPSVMLLGVAHPSWLLPTVESLKKLGCQRAWVVHGDGGSDELDLKETSLSEIQGGTKSENLSLAIEVLQLNNALGQVLLALRLGKKRIIAETGAGQHGVAAATACALFNLPCFVYMGETDIRRQSLNVYRRERRKA